MALALECLAKVKNSQEKPLKPVRNINLLLAAVSTLCGAFLITIPLSLICLLCVAALAMLASEEAGFRGRKRSYKALKIKQRNPASHNYFIQDVPFEIKLTTTL